MSKESSRTALLLAEVNMNHCVKTVYGTNEPHPEYVRRGRRYQTLLQEWTNQYGEEPYKNKTYYVVHLTDYLGWSDGYAIYEKEKDAQKAVDQCNNMAHWSCQGYSYYEEW